MLPRPLTWGVVPRGAPPRPLALMSPRGSQGIWRQALWGSELEMGPWAKDQALAPLAQGAKASQRPGTILAQLEGGFWAPKGLRVSYKDGTGAPMHAHTHALLLGGHLEPPPPSSRHRWGTAPTSTATKPGQTRTSEAES